MIFAIAWNGPAQGEVFECDASLCAVTLITNNGTHRYARYGAPAAGVVRFAFVHTLVT